MGKYILNRLLWLVVTVLVTAFLIFTILYFTPGEPARYLLGSSATAEEVEFMTAKLGLDQPYLVQFGQFMSQTFLHFDFGESWVYGVPVFEELANRLPYTLIISIVGMIFNVILGITLGIFAGTHEGKWQDSLTMTICMIFVSCPDFWVALMLIMLFCSKLNWLPSYGIGSWKCFVLPIFVSALPGIAVNARQTRSSILEVFREDYITTARAKGQKERVVVYNHMLPNALMPVVTSLGGGLSRIVAGVTVIEAVFSIPGVGLYLLTGVNAHDYPVIRSCVLFLAAFACLVMLLVDLAYAWIDPRIKVKFAGGGR